MNVERGTLAIMQVDYFKEHVRTRWLRGRRGFVESGGVVRNAQVAQEWTGLEELLSLISQEFKAS